jgi:hypothetical protein
MLNDLNNWDKIPTETYKLILEEAKIRYDELLSQSENITGKVIQTILINSAIITWFANYISTKNLSYKTLILTAFAIFVTFVFFWLVNILFPRKITLKGSSPKEIFGNELDLSGDIKGDNYDEDNKIKVYYYHQVKRYNNRIEKLRPIYSSRAEKYRWGLIFSLLLFGYIITIISLNF